jgi:Ca2+-binding EF-hand superfamily protein
MNVTNVQLRPRWLFGLGIVVSLAACAEPVAAANDANSAANAALFKRLDADGDGQIASREIAADNKRLFDRLVRKADANRDGTLTRDEFLAALVPSRPDKPIEAEEPATDFQADAVRWLLLSMDTSGNSWIERDEVPKKFQSVFNAMITRLDGNKNGMLERFELSQGARPLAQIAGRYVRREGIDAAAELKKLEKQLGAAARRFDAPRVQLENLTDRQKARAAFVQLDGNGNGQLEKSEAVGPFQRPFERLLRRADRDRDGQLSQREFLAAIDQLSRRQARQSAMRRPGSRPADSMPAEATPAENVKSLPADDSMPADDR